MATQETFTLTNTHGTSLTLAVMEHDGLGVPGISRAAQSGPYQHGQTLLSARLEPRTVTLKMRFLGSGSETALRTLLSGYARIVNDLDTALYLDTTLPDASIRRLDVYLADGLKMPRVAGDMRAAQTDVLQFVADDPIAYTPTLATVLLARGGGTSEGWHLDDAGTPGTANGWFMDSTPTSVDGWYLGGAVIDTSYSLNYTGTWRSFPVIRVTGPIDDCVITNNTTGEKLDFTGYSLAAGDYIDIDCRYGYKTVTEDDGDNHLGDLTSDSDLATFHIAPADEAPGGLNDFNVTGSACTGATTIYMSYYTRWISVL